MPTGTALSRSCFMCCGRCILSWINTLCIALLFSKLVQLNFFKSRMKKKSTNFEFFKPGNSSVSYTFVCCPATGPITWVLFISSASGACLTFGLALPSLSFHYVFTLLAHPGCLPAFSHTLPTTIACANLPLLSRVLWHTPCLIGVENMQKAPGVEFSQVFVLLPTELKPHLQFAVNVSRLIVFLSWSVLADECCQRLQLATAFNKSSSCT